MAGIKINAMGRKAGASAGREIFVTSPTLDAITVVDCALWICPPGRRFAITCVEGRWAVAGSTGAKAWIERVGPTVTVGSGTDTITTGGELDLTATAKVNYFQGIKQVDASDLESGGANIVEPGEMLCIETSGTLTNLAGFQVTISLRELPPLKSA